MKISDNFVFIHVTFYNKSKWINQNHSSLILSESSLFDEFSEVYEYEYFYNLFLHYVDC